MAGHVQIFLGGAFYPAIDLFGKPPTSVVLSEQRKKPSSLKVTWSGITDFSILSNPLLEANIFLSWKMHFDDDTTTTSRSGTYLIKSFSRTYPTDLGVTISVEAIDRKVVLQDQVKNSVYTNLKASDMAKIAAEEMGLTANIVESELVYKTMSMAGESTGTVLARLSANEDFEFFIRGSELVFEPSKERGKVKVLHYSTERPQGRKSGIRLLSFGISRETAGYGGGNKRKGATTGEDGSTLDDVFTSNQDRIDTFLGNNYFLGKSETNDSNHLKRYPTYAEKPSSAAVPGSPKDEGPGLMNTVSFFVGKLGYTQQDDVETPAIIDTMPDKGKDHVKTRNKTQAKFTRWKGYKITGKCWGGFLTPREFIQVSGIPDSDNGPWYLDSVTTTATENEIMTSFSGTSEPAKRSGKGKGTGDDRQGRTVEGSENGEEVTFDNVVTWFTGKRGFTQQDEAKVQAAKESSKALGAQQAAREAAKSAGAQKADDN